MAGAMNEQYRHGQLVQPVGQVARIAGDQNQCPYPVGVFERSP